ncbi:hypothetical protein AB1Y20_000907 [Prymnesium parvum]|uniref:Agmatinase n=1 Tax=Prymnesium parvum TaxID=97485 RepID=A0AB34K6T1_PRYPA
MACAPRLAPRAAIRGLSRGAGVRASSHARNATPPRYAGVSTFFRAPYVDMHACSLAGVHVGLLGVPFDGGASNRPGARYGPREVRSQSASHVRRINQSTGVAPFELGLRVADIGDAHVSRPFELVGAHAEVEAAVLGVARAGVTPIAVGGDHSVSLPILRALRRQSEAPLGLVHVDAHADTGDDYGGSRFHHGAPFKIAVDEGLIDPRRTIQIGIRGSLAFEGQWAFSHKSGMRVVYIDEALEKGVEFVLDEVYRVVGSSPAYLSFDIDALDPAFAPGTGTPEIGGLSTHYAQCLIRGLGVCPSRGSVAARTGIDLVGADLVEVSPPYDAADITSLAGANLVFEMLCVIAHARARRA